VENHVAQKRLARRPKYFASGGIAISEAAQPQPPSQPQQHFGIDLARAFGGAMIFSLPTLMTQEMWELGSSMSHFRLALLLLLVLPLLMGLAYYMGFEDSFIDTGNLLHTFGSYGIGFISAAIMLLLFAVIGPGMAVHEIVGRIALQAVPAAIGATLLHNDLGLWERHAEHAERKRQHAPYIGQVFLMVVGAIFLAISPASTFEMVLIAYKMTEWHALALIFTTLLVMHALVYAVQFRESAALSAATPFWSAFLRFTVVGYAIALLVSAYILWTFGRLENTAETESIKAVVVLGFPAALGAAAARLLL